MSQWDFAVNFFVALFALIDPIGNVPLFAAATNGVKSKDARWISVYIALFAFSNFLGPLLDRLDRLDFRLSAQARAMALTLVGEAS